MQAGQQGTRRNERPGRPCTSGKLSIIRSFRKRIRWGDDFSDAGAIRSIYNANKRRREERTPHRNSRDVRSRREQRHVYTKAPFEQQSPRRQNAEHDADPAKHNKQDLGDAVHGYQPRFQSCLPADRSSVGDARTDYPMLSHRAGEQTHHQHVPPATPNTHMTGHHGSFCSTIKSPNFLRLSFDQRLYQGTPAPVLPLPEPDGPPAVRRTEEGARRCRSEPVGTIAARRRRALLTRHHDVEKVPVSDLCNEQELQPSLFYA